MNQPLDKVMEVLKCSRGVNLSGYRSGTLKRRIELRITRVTGGDIDAYLHLLKTDPQEADRLISAITIKVTTFFRDPLVFELLSQDILTTIIKSKIKTKSREIRIWSAGCATGEEAYSLAMLVHMALKEQFSKWNIHIFATDLDDVALERASNAIYERSALKNVKLGLLDRYFAKEGEKFKVKPVVADMVQFAKYDLTSQNLSVPAESIFGGFDLVLCRNVLIYFLLESQRNILKKLSNSISKGGYLVLGDSESLSKELDFKLYTVDRKNRIFCKM